VAIVWREYQEIICMTTFASKTLALAALPFALGLAACADSTPDAAADGDMTAAEATDDAMAAPWGRPTPRPPDRA
jgi:hypothetical protein